MSRTYNTHPSCKNWIKYPGGWIPRWGNPGTGKWWKRQYHKASRSLTRGTGGRERSMLRYGRECNWKLS